MKEFDSRLEAVWTYVISKEKLFKRLVEQGIFDKETTDEILEHMYSQFNLDYNPNFAPSPVGEVMYASKVDVPRACVSLTDIARAKTDKNPGYLIQSWLRSDNTIEFLRAWELKNNKKFDNDECEKLLSEIKQNGSTLTPKLWSERTNATGLISTKGKGGGTKADTDIALAFRAWLNPDIMLEMISRFKYYEIQFNKKDPTIIYEENINPQV